MGPNGCETEAFSQWASVIIIFCASFYCLSSGKIKNYEIFIIKSLYSVRLGTSFCFAILSRGAFTSFIYGLSKMSLNSLRIKIVHHLPESNMNTSSNFIASSSRKNNRIHKKLMCCNIKSILGPYY